MDRISGYPQAWRTSLALDGGRRLLAVLLLATGVGWGASCVPNKMLIVDQTVLSGRPGAATLQGDTVKDLGPIEMVAFYQAKDEETIYKTQDAAATVVDFVHFVDMERKDAKEVRIVRLLLTKFVQHQGIRSGAIRIPLQPLLEEGKRTIPMQYFVRLANGGNVPIKSIHLIDSLPPEFHVNAVKIQDTRRTANIVGAVFLWWLGWIYVPQQTLVEFDSLSYEVRTMGDREVLILDFDMQKKPLDLQGENNSTIFLAVEGELQVPQTLKTGGAQ